MNTYSDRIKETLSKWAKEYILPANIQVQFSFRDMDDRFHVICWDFAHLDEDWWSDDCEFCPENDTELLTLWFITPKEIVAFNTIELCGLTFEDLMEIFDDCF